MQPGYTYKKDSKVEVTIDGSRLPPVHRGRARLGSFDADDQTLIDAMKRGCSMTVRGTSTRDTYSLDTYSLNGFTAAYRGDARCLRKLRPPRRGRSPPTAGRA